MAVFLSIANEVIMDDFILVTGATGKTGLALVEQLNGADVDVRAATRSPYAAGQVRFEWQDRSTHRSALNGVTGVYLVAPTDANEHLPIMRPFLEDALEAGVQRFVLLSASILDRSEEHTSELQSLMRISYAVF